MPSDKDRCFLYRTNGEGTTLVSVTVVEFLVLGSIHKMMEQFYTYLSEKCTVKRLGKPTEFLAG